MTDQIAILTIAVTIAFAFGMAIGTASERARQRRRKAQRDIDWMRGVGHYPNLEKFVTDNADELADRRRRFEPGDWPHRDSFVRRPR